MEATSLREDQLAFHLDLFMAQLQLTVLQKEAKIGAFRLDAIAGDGAGSLVVVELKVVASKDVLGQLLIYPRVLRNALTRMGMTPPPIRSLLITTHLDSNVVELSAELNAMTSIEIYVCTGSWPDDLRLVAPSAAPCQVWDQGTVRGRCDIEQVCEFIRMSRADLGK